MRTALPASNGWAFRRPSITASRFPRIALLAGIILFVRPIPATAQKKPVTLGAINSARTRGGFTPVWSPAGDRFVYSESDALHLVDCNSAKDTDVLRLSQLRSVAVKTPEAATFDWTNRRVAAEPIQWFPSGKQLLVSEGGDLFLVPLTPAAGDPPFTQLTATAEAEQDAKLSPDGKLVGFRRGHDLYVLRVQDRKLTRLTHDGNSTLLNGEMDWVYPEELELPTAWWWSPDNRHIAYMQFDISREPVFPQISLTNVTGKLEPERYPQPGDPNPDVRIGVVSAEGGSTRWLDLGDTRGQLLARVEWLPSSTAVAVERLNRVQNRLDLIVADAHSGTSHVLLHEEDPYWINVNNHLHFFRDGSRFLWGSERDGFLHLYLYGTDGKLQRQITQGEWQVEKVLQVDEARGTIYYQSTEASPLESQFYSISLNGDRKQRLSPDKGSHAIQLSPSFAYWTDSFSSLTAAPRTTLYRSDGSTVMVLRKPDTTLAEYDLQTPEIHTVKTPDGALLYGRLIKPAGFTAGRKYPVIVEVYGGPGNQTVHDRWLGLTWEEALAQRGFVVWQMDNRGSAGRGHKFETPIFRNLGERELADQLLGLDYLNSLGFTDPSRVGLYGWSYGGYMTLYSLCNAPERFQVGVAGAPVTSWRTYDSIYTERYMGLPEENPEAYDKTSPITHAGNLKARLLIIHNIEDDNVHFQNTIRMTSALERSGKKFGMLVYPQKSHAVTGPERNQMLQSITDFFEQALKPQVDGLSLAPSAN
jgi:dipeptidyl-peptidase-4